MQIEEEVTNLMLKALKYCNIEMTGHRQLSAQYRTATVQHRLASLYHNSYRNEVRQEATNCP